MELIFLILIIIAIVSFVVFALLKPSNTVTSEDKADYFQNKAQPGQNAVQGAFTKAQLKRDAKLQELANEATSSAISGLRQTIEADEVIFEKEALPERHYQTLVKEKADTQTYLAEKQTELKDHQLREKLIDLALAQGFDVDTYLKQQLNELEAQKLEREVMVKLKAGFVYQLQDYQKLTMLRSNLDELYERENLVESGNENDSVKQKKLAQIRADIETLEKDANGRRQGLLSAYNGEEIGGSDPDSEP